jgi:hypothetical protein
MRIENTEITFNEVKVTLETKAELFFFTKLLGSATYEVDSEFKVDSLDLFRKLKTQIELQNLTEEYNLIESYTLKRS